MADGLTSPTAPPPSTQPGAPAARYTPTLTLGPPPAELVRIPLVQNNHSPGWLSDTIAGIIEGKTPMWWWAAFIPSVLCLTMLLVLLTYLVSTGVGIWGVTHPTPVETR